MPSSSRNSRSIVTPVVAENVDLAGSGIEQAFEDFDGGRFARAIGSEQAEAFAGLDLEVEAADGFHFAVVGLAQVAALDGGGHSAFYRR